ncbi:MAG: hypothetical protein JAY84_00345 [Candidatus Thiodiazotropha taylori]|nr:hypothetical protein [Candidatus Thiodiazotropha taylori]
MELRALNKTGIEAFKTFLHQLRQDESIPVPTDILTDSTYSEKRNWGITIQDKEFATRYELGEYLTKLFKGKKTPSEVSSDNGLWAWLALYFFEQICKHDEDGNLKPEKDDSNYILSDTIRNWHRHAIRTTFMFVQRYGDKVRFMFSSSMNTRGELTEQISATQYLISCSGVIDTASKLYTDAIEDTPKRGAASSSKGSIRRFVAFLNQITLTYDVYQLNSKQLMDLLPSEFDRFIAQN